jgi:hypothetical protein
MKNFLPTNIFKVFCPKMLEKRIEPKESRMTFAPEKHDKAGSSDFRTYKGIPFRESLFFGIKFLLCGSRDAEGRIFCHCRILSL